MVAKSFPSARSPALARTSPLTRVVIGVALVLVVALAYWLLFYTDETSRMDAARRQGAQLTNDLAMLQQAQASYLADRDELALRQQRQRELNKVLPPETEQAAFLSAVQQVSNASGVDLKGWQPLEEKRETFYARVPMRLEMSGRFFQIAKFADEIRKLDRIIDIENVQLSAPHMEGDDVVLSARALATTFHMVTAKPVEPKK